MTIRFGGWLIAAMIFLTPMGVFAEDGLQQRAKVMTDMGRALRVVVIEIRRSHADMTKLALNIEILVGNAPLLRALFVNDIIPPGSEASPEIWTAPAEFAKAVALLEGAAAELADAADDGEKARIKQGVRRVSAACSHCHQRFRVLK